MELEALGRWMVRRGAVDAGGLVRARRRQSLYGGTLDTALLELDLCDEKTVEAQLAEASGLVPGERSWLEAVRPDVALLMDAGTARRLGAQPIRREGDVLQIAVRYGADLAAVAAWAARQDRGADFRVVPEIRLEALWARLHEVSVPTRFARLLGKLMGAEKAHRSTHSTAGRQVARPLVETGPTPGRRPRPRPVASPTAARPSAAKPAPAPADIEPVEAPAPPAARLVEAPTARTPAAPRLRDTPPAPAAAAPRLVEAPAARVARVAAVPVAGSPAPAASEPPPAVDVTDDLEESADELLPLLEAAPPGSAERSALLRRLRPFADDPRLADRLNLWRQRVAEGDEEAARALGAIADREAVPSLLELVGSDSPDVREAALTALRAITVHDFGRARWRWTRWWREFEGKHRVEWLLDALGAHEPELRLEAARELEQLSGRYVGYHFDLGKRDRDEARRRWQDWWLTAGRKHG